MSLLRFTLLSEGSSDRALIPVLVWALQQHSRRAISWQWADLRRLPKRYSGLRERIQGVLEYYPCDLLFIHRDADNAGLEKRRREIVEALDGIEHPPAVCVIPVRALEAWFLSDEPAIRRAAGNPNGKAGLGLPSIHQVEDTSDPKALLHAAIRSASGLSGRRKRRIESSAAVHRISDLVTDFSLLRHLSAFRTFEADLQRILVERFESP